MCGIVGVAGEVSYQDEKAFTLMLQFDVIRGHHSTGICKVGRHTDNVEIDKHAGTAWEFFNESSMYNNKKGITGCNKLLLGHNRWATIGAHTSENAHPFETKNLVGVHNGTLDYETFGKIDKENEYEVDSEALYNLIDEVGIEKAIPQCSGAWSLVYYDKEEKNLHFIRNNKRPMCYAFKKDKSVLYFASEAWMIEVACNKAGVKIHDVHETDENILYTLKLSGRDFKSGVSYTYQKEEIKGAVKKTHVHRNYGGNYYGGSYTFGNSYKTGSKKERRKQNKNHRLMQLHVNEMKDDKGYIDIYYNPMDYTNGCGKDYLIMRTCSKDYPVKLLTGLNIDTKNEIRNAKGVMYKCKQNSYSWIPSGSVGEDMYSVVAQYNSLSKPITRKFEEKEEDNVINLPNLYSKSEGYWDKDTLEWVSYSHMIYGYGGREITDLKFHSLIANGCSNCTKNWVETCDSDLVHWISNDEFLCPVCAEGNNEEGTMIQ